MEDITVSSLTKPVRCIVKLGGAAITCKNELEKINEENLEIVSSHLRQAMISGSSSQKVLGMDWSKRPGKSDISCDADDFKEEGFPESSSFVVVHGAGSFGHFQASRSGVHKGGLNQPVVQAGFVATRISLQHGEAYIDTRDWKYDLRNRYKFTMLQLSTLKLFERWLERVFLQLACLHFHVDGQPLKEMLEMTSADLSMVGKAIDSGFVPVLHGDAVLDDLQGCTILSGDVIIRHLADHLKPEYVVFLMGRTMKFVIQLMRIKTDVLGVYDRPPSESGAVLLKEIAVNEDGSWSVVKPAPHNMNKQVEITVAAHDTTGGMVTKISEAAMIAKLGIDVYIVKAATIYSLRALRGEVRGAIPDDWLGTAIRFAGAAAANGTC